MGNHFKLGPKNYDCYFIAKFHSNLQMIKGTMYQNYTNLETNLKMNIILQKYNK